MKHARKLQMRDKVVVWSHYNNKKNNDLGVNEFYSTRRSPMRCFEAFILKKKIDRG